MIDNMLAHAAFVHTVSESAEDGYLHVYPNPAARTVQIETVKLMKYHVIERMELLDPSGRMVEQWSNLPTKFWFDASKYPAGQYFLKVETNLRSETVPLILGAR